MANLPMGSITLSDGRKLVDEGDAVYLCNERGEKLWFPGGYRALDEFEEDFVRSAYAAGRNSHVNSDPRDPNRPCPTTGIRPQDLNRRVEVEQRLLDAAGGKKALPTADECRALALRLGTPESTAKLHSDSTEEIKS